MRKTILCLLFCVVAHTAILNKVHAQSTLIHYWHFNAYSLGTMYTPTINAIPADFTDLPGSNPAILYRTLPGTSSAYSSFLEGFTSLSTDYDTVNLRMSQPSGMYIRTRNPSDSMELLFYTPSTHFNNLVFTFGTSRPVNGPVHQNYDYSIDSGVTWTTTGLSLLTDSVWSVFQRITLTTSNAAVNNNPKLVFRVTWTGNTTGTSGNNRFDNVTLDGDSITAATGVYETAAKQDNFTVYPNPAGDNIDVSTFAEGVKHVMITNALGQKLYEGTQEQQQFSISTANLTAGIYFISISDEVSGEVRTMRFLKQ